MIKISICTKHSSIRVKIDDKKYILLYNNTCHFVPAFLSQYTDIRNALTKTYD